MAEHRVRKNEIIYIIPTDELFQKWKSDEAYIDDYGRLINRKPHRVLKELKHYAAHPPVPHHKETNPPVAPAQKSFSLKEYCKDAVRNKTIEASEKVVDWAVDKLFYEVLPNVWQEHIVPFYHTAREVLTTKELKVDAVRSQAKTRECTAVKPKLTAKMTKEEADAEKRKVLYHWLGLLESLTKLQSAGELDATSTLAQLTDPAMLEQVNRYLRENPNLLETNRYLLLHHLLGGDLYKEGQLLPIGAAEIKGVAASYGFATEIEKMEDKLNG